VDAAETEQVAERVAPLFARPATVVTIDNEACTHQVCVCMLLVYGYNGFFIIWMLNTLHFQAKSTVICKLAAYST